MLIILSYIYINLYIHVLYIMRIRARREQGDLFNEYHVEGSEGFKVSPSCQRKMIAILIFLILCTIVMFIKVKINPNYFGEQTVDDF
jgi:hypothetical protein